MPFASVINPYKKAFQRRRRTDIYAAWPHIQAGASGAAPQRLMDRADWIVMIGS